MSAPSNSITIFDRKSIQNRRKRCAHSFSDHDFLFSWAEEQIFDRLDVVKRDFPSVVHIGGRHSSDFSTRMQKQVNAESFYTMDSADGDIIAEEDFLPLKPGSIDLITSTLNLHSVNDLPGALLQIRKALKPDGLFVAALFGGETLHELRQSLMHSEIALKGGASPRVFPFADKQDMGALLQRGGFALPVVDSDIVTVTYDTMFKLMHDLRGMGESNTIAERSRSNPGKMFFMEAAKHYAENFAESDGRIVASFEVVFLLGWAPHESQQQPLKPGSAKNRLADALQTDEIKTGEMP